MNEVLPGRGIGERCHLGNRSVIDAILPQTKLTAGNGRGRGVEKWQAYEHRETIPERIGSAADSRSCLSKLFAPPPVRCARAQWRHTPRLSSKKGHSCCCRLICSHCLPSRGRAASSHSSGGTPTRKLSIKNAKMRLCCYAAMLLCFLTVKQSQYWLFPSLRIESGRGAGCRLLFWLRSPAFGISAFGQSPARVLGFRV